MLSKLTLLLSVLRAPALAVYCCVLLALLAAMVAQGPGDVEIQFDEYPVTPSHQPQERQDEAPPEFGP